MPRFKLVVEYAGTRYSGWQTQLNARTIQGELRLAVIEVTARKDFELYGAGRTDAGVHAAGQVAHLDVATSFPPHTLQQRLNDQLPSDIHIRSVANASRRFHARHDAVARRYLYQVAKRRTAFAKPYVWWVKDPLDVKRMRETAHAFVGTHDFASFAAADRNDEEASTFVRLDRLEVVEEGGLLLVVIEGSHFLWKMVRRIVGVMVAAGKGELSPSAAAALLVERSALPAKLAAPASGLFLERVFYEGDARDKTVHSITPVTL